MATTTNTTTISSDHGAHFFQALRAVLERVAKDHLPGAEPPSTAWFNDPVCNNLLVEGEAIGAITRWSTTQVHWTEAGVARYHELTQS